jgi:acyl transferase domain-containing protein
MAAMRTLDRRGKHLFVEIGPAATLTPLGKRCVPPGRHVWLPSIRPNEKDGDVVLDAVARAYAAGQPISWPDFHRGQRRRRIELPTYAFDRRSYRLPAGPVDRTPAAPADGASAGQGAKADPAATNLPAGNGVAGEAVLTAPEGGERRTAITELIRGKVATLLEFPELSDVEADIDFSELGMDSLLAVKLRKELCASLSISFATPEIFNNPTPLALAEFLDGCLEKVA